MDVALIERFYSKLFSTPKEYVSAGIILCSVILASLLNGGTFFCVRYLLMGVAAIVLFLIFQRSLRLAFNNRRLVFFVMIILIFIELFDVLVVHTVGRELVIIAPASITALLTVVLYFTSESSELKSSLFALFLVLLLYPISYLFSFKAPHRAVGYTLTAILGVIAGSLYIRFLNKNFEFFNVRRFLKAFVLSWLTNEAEYFERELKAVGIPKRGWVKCLMIGKAKLISVSFHPGPMRNIGGAKLVDRLLESVNDSMFLHTAVKHDLNPVDEDEVNKIVSAVKCDGKSLTAKKPYEIEGERYILRVFPFGDVRLMILIGKFASDDVPYEVNEFAERFGDVVFVESHSSYEKNFNVGEKEVREIKDLIRRAFEVETDQAELRYHFARKEVRTKNICGYIAMLVLDYGDERHAILMLDGNNVDKDFRREIEDFGKKNGVKITVISTDNHSKTGISPRIGYKPVGMDEDDRKAVFEFLESIFSNLKLERCERITYSKNTVEVKVMGERFFELVDMAFRDFGERAIYVFIAMIVFQFIISILLGSLII